MLKSMTGYGIAIKEDSKVQYTVEIKSLNSKYLELNLRTPKAIADLELEIRNEVSKALLRGKVSVTISSEYKDATALASTINTALFKKYFEDLKPLAADISYSQTDLFQQALNMPDVISENNADKEISKEEKDILWKTISEAIEKFNEFRGNEGRNIKEDLKNRVRFILERLGKVEKLEINRIPQIRERISSLMEEWIGSEKVDENRFEQEMIYYIDKLDITEEKVRLKSHCDYFIKVLDSAEPGGKKLNFITQEMGREINTLGSKANNAAIQQLVIGMKEELEKIKEQILNVV